MPLPAILLGFIPIFKKCMLSNMLVILYSYAANTIKKKDSIR